MAIVYSALALARADDLDAGAGLAGHLHAAWLITHGEAADSPLLGDHVLADQLQLAFYPVAWLTRWVPARPLLLGLQSASLAVAVVPLWRLARRVAQLRVGAAAALLIAYAVHPGVTAMNLADFHMTTVAVGPLMVAAYMALAGSWLRYAAFAAVAVACDADLGLLVAGMGLWLVLEGKNRVGLASIVLGLGWTALAVLVIEPHWGTAGLIEAGSFADYGDSALDVLIAMVQNPIRVLGDLFAEENVEVVVLLFAPLLFLPALAPRMLIPAVPLQALIFVADVPLTGPEGAYRSVPLLVFAYVAAAMAMVRLGRRSTERVLVDRRVLAGVVVAALGFWLVDSASSPYRTPWRWAQPDPLESARRRAVELVDDSESIRAAAPLLPLLAARLEVRLLPRDDRDGTAAAEGVDVVVFDADWAGWPADEVRDFAAAVDRAGFELVFRGRGVSVFVRGS